MSIRSLDKELIVQEQEKSAARTYDLKAPAFFAAPDPTLKEMREHDPVYWCEPLQCWVLTRYDDVQYVIKDKAFSVDRGGFIGRGGSPHVRPKLDACNEFLLQWMVFSDPPRHTRLRALVTDAFSPRAIGRLRESIEGLLAEVLDDVRPKGRMDVVADLAVPFPAMVTGHMLGLPRERTADLKRWSDKLFEFFGAGIASDELIESTYDTLEECRSYFASVVAERRKNPGEDMVSRLIAARDRDDKLSEDELVGMCGTLMAGAYETTTHLIANGLYALLKNPDQLDLLKKQPQLIDDAVEELFRFIGPALSLFRRATKDVEIGGKLISSGQNICIMMHAANHDPRYFPEPERLDILRQNKRHLGLGLGIHFCLGAALTRMEVRCALRELVQLPGLRLAGGEPEWFPNLVMRGMRSLPITFTPRVMARAAVSQAGGAVGLM